MKNDFDRHLLKTRFGHVHYWSTGSGPALLLLHQAAQSADEFLAIAPLLAGGFRLVALDYPGHGASDTPAHELTVQEYCESVMAVVDELGIDKMHVFGHHSGGILAVALAVAHPERFGRLAISGAGLSDPAVAELLLNNPMTRDLPVDGGGEFLQKTWDVYRKMSAAGTTPDTTFLPFVAGLNARLRPYDMHYELLRWDYEASWTRLQHETLLIKGEFDHFSGDIEGLDEALPNSRRTDIPGGGAWLLYEQAGAVASAITEFLEQDVVEA